MSVTQLRSKQAHCNCPVSGPRRLIDRVRPAPRPWAGPPDRPETAQAWHFATASRTIRPIRGGTIKVSAYSREMEVGGGACRRGRPEGKGDVRWGRSRGAQDAQATNRGPGRGLYGSP
jgi:hypothetical protein